MAHKLEPGDWITGPFWERPVQIVACKTREGYALLTVAADAGVTCTWVLAPDDRAQLARVTPADRRQTTFDGDPTRFRLAIEAHRLRLAHSIDPYAALNASRIDPLPHQFEAVYEHLLARPVVRALLAHDAGAGKTIMAGMVIKELQRRQGVKRVLIVAPAGLTIQWQRELLTKFGEDFAIVDREFIQQQRSDDLRIWRETDHAITSIAFARQDRLRQALSSVDWDLVIVDEAHKMAAYVRPNGSVQKTQAYKLGEIFSQHSTHFLLMTATPHKGDPDNYRLLVSLIGDQWGDAAVYADGANPMVLRRTKEEMCKPNGEPLYPTRTVVPKYYNISHEEGDLLEQVQKFIRRHYDRAKSANRMGATFALLTLERRMASSPYALQESLKRIREKLTNRLTGGMVVQLPDGEEDWADWEDLSERERWEREAQAETDAALVFRRRELKAELRQVDRLIERASALTQQGEQEKLETLQDACDLWIGDNNEQLIVFTEFKDTLDYLVQHIEDWGYTTTQIHGGMDLKDRRAAERTFWDGAAQVLVATEAAGEGINLQCCSVMVNYDIPWNPCRLEQRMGRIHRYGQKADEVYIFNMIAPNTMEGQVKDALLKKMETMREDLGDKVFDVVGQVLWADADLRDILERIALGETGAVDDALEAIERGGARAREAYTAESRVTSVGEPLDVAAFRRKQATFAAHRLSPEAAEAFFRRALPLAGGALTPFLVTTKDDDETRTGLDVVVPAELGGGRKRKLRVSFWSAVCSDDEMEDDAVLFIAPGHWLFEALIDWVIEACAPDLRQGGVFCDLQPASERPYLIWFAQSQIRDGLDRHVGDLLTAVEHRADEEAVTPRPSEILDGFEVGEVGEDDVHQVQPMLAAQEAVVDQCVRQRFLPALAEQREEKREALARDRAFLSEGLNGLAEYLSEAAVDAFSEGNIELGSDLTDQAERARERLSNLQAEMDRAGRLLMTAPEVLGVALVLPAPLEIEVETEEGVTRVLMRRDDAVEQAAMDAVMDYERRRGRFPKDVHKGESWDIESYDEQGHLVRYIEVKGRGPEDADVVTMTEPEWAAAGRLGKQHWLYIVRLGDGQMWMLQDPTAKLEPRLLKRLVVKVRDVATHSQSVKLEDRSAYDE